MSGKLTGDLKLYLKEGGTADINVEGRFADEDEGLETAVMMSLFTDRRAEDDDNFPDESEFKGGYWGDGLKGFKFGSRAWLLRRAKLTTDTIEKYKEYYEEALEWLVEDEVASQVSVTVTRVDNYTIDISVEIYRFTDRSTNFRYFFNWENETIRKAA